MVRVSRVVTSTWRGWTVEWRGTRRTSSNVRASRARTRLSMKEATDRARASVKQNRPASGGAAGLGRRRRAAAPTAGPSPAAPATSSTTALPAAARPLIIRLAADIASIVLLMAVDRHPPRPQRVLHRLGQLLERGRRRGALHGVAGLEELDVVEHLVDPVVRERRQLALDPLPQELVHGDDVHQLEDGIGEVGAAAAAHPRDDRDARERRDRADRRRLVRRHHDVGEGVLRRRAAREDVPLARREVGPQLVGRLQRDELDRPAEQPPLEALGVGRAAPPRSRC